MEIIYPLCQGCLRSYVSYDNEMFHDIFDEIHSKSLGALWHQRSIHWENEDQLQTTVRHSRAFLMELTGLKSILVSGDFDKRARCVAKIKYASSGDEEWFREEHQTNHGFPKESDAYRFEHRTRYKSLSKTEKERDYSLAAREEQIAIFNRIDEVFSDNRLPLMVAMEYFVNTAITRQIQTRFLDLFLPTVTPYQENEIWRNIGHNNIPVWDRERQFPTSDSLAREYGYINNAWQETREVLDSTERVLIINRIFHPAHAEPQAQGIVDQENVMNERRIAKSKTSLEALYTHLTPGFDLQKQYPDIVRTIEAYIQGLKTSERTPPKNPLFYGTRAGKTEIGHALFVLNGVKNTARGDYDSLADNYLYQE